MTRKHSPSQRKTCSFQPLEDRRLMAADLVAAVPETAAVPIADVQAIGHLANSMLIGPAGIAGIEPAETVEIADVSADFVFAGPQVLFDGPNRDDSGLQDGADNDPAGGGEADRTESDEGSAVQDQANQQPQQGARRAHHVIRRADGGWTDEYVDYDQDGNRIGRTFETYDRSGVLRERQTIRVDEDGNRTTTTDNYDEDGKWTGSTTESFDADGRRTGGQKRTLTRTETFSVNPTIQKVVNGSRLRRMTTRNQRIGREDELLVITFGTWTVVGRTNMLIWTPMATALAGPVKRTMTEACCANVRQLGQTLTAVARPPHKRMTMMVSGPALPWNHSMGVVIESVANARLRTVTAERIRKRTTRILANGVN
ncbi:MAG: hypothetical protein R3C28_09265 [Pirellulaceae bacterium]